MASHHLHQPSYTAGEYHKDSGLPYAGEDDGAFSSKVQDDTQCFWKVDPAIATIASASDTSGSVGSTPVVATMGVITIFSLVLNLA